MAEPKTIAEVWLWGSFVGAVMELEDGRVLFEFDRGFAGRGIEISPIHLRARRGPIEFPELSRKAAFNGLPGVLADALPDSFGTSVIRTYYTARGEMAKALSPVQHLLYVGSRAIGALEFRPAEDLDTRPHDMEALRIAELVSDARRIVDGDPDVAVPEIYRIGSSAGGMRPKAVILHNNGVVRSAFASPRPGDTPAILKFDGVDPHAAPGMMGRPQHFNRVEAAYAVLARKAGLDVVNIEVLEQAGGYAHLLIPRFDLDATGSPLHQHTLGGLLHVDYNESGASSYEEYMRAALALGLPVHALHEAFRRMVFNVMAINQDDHVKNLSFHMLQDGSWKLTPAYDLTFAQGQGWTRRHQMRVNGKIEGISRADLITVAETFALKRAEETLDQVSDALAAWEATARSLDIPSEAIQAIAKALRDRREQVLG